MDTEFDTVVERIFRIDRIVRQLDESIRPLAFQILAQAAAPEATASSGPTKTAAHIPLAGLPAFAARHGDETPAHNMLALVAWMYRHDGNCLITPQNIKALAEVCGLAVPRRPDCTLRYASHHSRPLFQRQGYGWLLTPYGKAYVRQTFGTDNPAPTANA